MIVGFIFKSGGGGGLSIFFFRNIYTCCCYLTIVLVGLHAFSFVL